MTTPTTAGGAVLPAEVVKRLESSLDWMLKGMHTGPLVSALDYQLIIGWLGQIDPLRAELRAMTDDRDSWCAQASARTEDAVRFAAERDALKAAQDDQARDAARYRKLRRQDWFASPLAVIVNPKDCVKPGSDCPSRDRLDAMIDAIEETP